MIDIGRARKISVLHIGGPEPGPCVPKLHRIVVYMWQGMKKWKKHPNTQSCPRTTLELKAMPLLVSTCAAYVILVIYPTEDASRSDAPNHITSQAQLRTTVNFKIPSAIEKHGLTIEFISRVSAARRCEEESTRNRRTHLYTARRELVKNKGHLKNNSRY